MTRELPAHVREKVEMAELAEVQRRQLIREAEARLDQPWPPKGGPTRIIPSPNHSAPPIARGRPIAAGYRSLLEAEYAALLDAQRVAGEILAWWYEPWTFNLVGEAGTNKCVKYRIDFLVLPANREIEIHETKGRWRRGERERLKHVAATLPFIVKAVTRDADGWHTEIFS